MDSESLAQIQQIVTAATETIEARLGDRITEVRRELGDQISEVQQRTEIMATKINEVQRHTGVLIEDLHHKFELVIEGQQVLHREIADVRTELQQESQETRGLLRVSYQQLQQRVENLE